MISWVYVIVAFVVGLVVGVVIGGLCAAGGDDLGVGGTDGE